MTKLVVGQKLWLVPRLWDVGAHEVTVGKVGPKWADISSHRAKGRIDVNTLAVDGKGMSSPAQCYLSQSDYERFAYKQNLWRELATRIRSFPQLNPDVTTEDIEKAAALLRVDLSAVKSKKEETT